MQSSEDPALPLAEADIDEDLEEPRLYVVFLLNDDYSTMEFVIEVLQRFFGKNEEEAMKVMLAVHHKGKGAAGVYPFEIAETKSEQVMEEARKRGFPLKCLVEPEP